jgi:hypothetical protein
MTEIVIYTGISLSWADAGALLDADYRPPVKRNDINIQPGRKKPDIIGIIDGIFFDRAAVGHREIIRALKAGVIVVGGSSMGALRASELDSYGMIGVGRIYEWYRDGIIESDDEVAVTFHPETLEPLSIPLVNIRTTLEYAAGAGMIDTYQTDILLQIARSMYYPNRSYHAIVKAGVKAGIITLSRQDEILDFLIKNEVDVKRDDALLVIRKIRQLAESL